MEKETARRLQHVCYQVTVAGRGRQHCLVIWNEESLRVLELEYGLYHQIPVCARDLSWVGLA